MKYFFYLIFLIVLVGLNLGVFSFFKIWGVGPNLLLIFVMLFALDKEGLDFFFISLIAGLFLDFYSGIFLGGFSFGFVLLAYLLNLSARKLAIPEQGWKFLSGALFLSVVFMDLFLWAYYAAVFKLGWAPVNFIDPHLLLNRFLIQFFYDLLLLFPVLECKRFFQQLLARFATGL